jgi:hypothetical protein
LGRAAALPGGIEHNGRHRPAFHGIGELEIDEAGPEFVCAGGAMRRANEERQREERCQEHVSHSTDPSILIAKFASLCGGLGTNFAI